MLSVGQTAPDFICPGVVDGTGRGYELFSIVDRHEAIVLYFHPGAYVPPCSAELRSIDEAGWGDYDGLAVICLSADGIYALSAYAREYGLPFVFCSDLHAGIADSYDVLLEEWQGMRNVPSRAAYVLDGWEIVFAEATADPLEEASPSPLEAGTGVIREIGVDVDRPRVRYE